MWTAAPQNCCNERQIWRPGIYSPVPRKDCLMKRGDCQCCFFKNRLHKKATELAEPEINKPAFGQGKAFKDMIHSPLLSITCLVTLIFGIFLKVLFVPTLIWMMNQQRGAGTGIRMSRACFLLQCCLTDLELLTSCCILQDCASTNKACGNSSAS